MVSGCAFVVNDLTLFGTFFGSGGFFEGRVFHLVKHNVSDKLVLDSLGNRGSSGGGFVSKLALEFGPLVGSFVLGFLGHSGTYVAISGTLYFGSEHAHCAPGMFVKENGFMLAICTVGMTLEVDIGVGLNELEDVFLGQFWQVFRGYRDSDFWGKFNGKGQENVMIEDFGQVSIGLGVKDFFPCREDVVFNGREESDVSNATNTDVLVDGQLDHNVGVNVFGF